MFKGDILNNGCNLQIVETKNAYYSVQNVSDERRIGVKVVKFAQKDGKAYHSVETYYGDDVIGFLGGVHGMMLQFEGKVQLQTTVIDRITNLQ